MTNYIAQQKRTDEKKNRTTKLEVEARNNIRGSDGEWERNEKNWKIVRAGLKLASNMNIENKTV